MGEEGVSCRRQIRAVPPMCITSGADRRDPAARCTSWPCHAAAPHCAGVWSTYLPGESQRQEIPCSPPSPKTALSGAAQACAAFFVVGRALTAGMLRGESFAVILAVVRLGPIRVPRLGPGREIDRPAFSSLAPSEPLRPEPADPALARSGRARPSTPARPSRSPGDRARARPPAAGRCAVHG